MTTQKHLIMRVRQVRHNHTSTRCVHNVAPIRMKLQAIAQIAREPDSVLELHARDDLRYEAHSRANCLTVVEV